MPECIVLDVPASYSGQALEEVGKLLNARHGLRSSAVVARLVRREKRGSTALGYGVAIPHADVPGLGRPLAAFVRMRDPVPFDAPDRQPVRDLLVLVVPRPAMSVHFDMLTHYRALLSNREFREQLAACEDETSVWRLFERHEWR